MVGGGAVNLPPPPNWSCTLTRADGPFMVMNKNYANYGSWGSAGEKGGGGGEEECGEGRPFDGHAHNDWPFMVIGHAS